MTTCERTHKHWTKRFTSIAIIVISTVRSYTNKNNQMSTPYQNCQLSIDEPDYRYMTTSERSMVIEEIKDDWMSDHNNTIIQVRPLIHSILKTDFDVILASVNYDGSTLSMAAEELRGNSVIVLAAVTQNGWSLKAASRELRCNKEIVMAAVNNQGFALQFSSDELKGDFDIVMAAVKQCGFALQFASLELKNNSQIVVTAVMNTGYALEFAEIQRKNDFNIVMKVMKQCGWALKYTSKELRGNKDIVLAALGQNSDAFQFINLNVFIISLVHHSLEYQYNTTTYESKNTDAKETLSPNIK